MIITAPYGSWESSITLSMLTDAGVRLGDVVVDGDDLYWTEGRAQEGGRTVIVRRDARGVIADVTPAGFNARSRAHEYGGGAYSVRDGVLISCSFEDQRVYLLGGDGPVAITPEPEIPAGDRYADFVFHGDNIICVRERHRESGEPVNSLVVFPLDGSEEPRVIAEGYDFYSSPRVSPDGATLAWLSWDHPRMPWDGTELWGAALAEDGFVSEPELLAGGEADSIFQPEWSPDGVLHFVSDRSGWWNLFRMVDDRAEMLHGMEAEFGLPQWQFGMRRYGFASRGRIVTLYSENGFDQIGIVEDGMLRRVQNTSERFGYCLGVRGDVFYATAGSGGSLPAVVGIDIETGGVEVVRTSLDIDIDPGLISHPKPIEFPTTHGAVAFAFYYPPRNPSFMGPAGEQPPLLVLSHGGPTSSTSPVLDVGIQFWTSRGFAVVDVNYRGSTGYGRRYRDALRGEWGVSDVDDCINAALYLADAGLADPNRMAIRGGSAGGYTTLCALTFSDVFAAGASYYGVGDLAALAADTHKFESRYLDSLIGPYPEAADLYDERSPLRNLDGLSCPVILLQGLDDDVVPPAQAQEIVAALDARGIPHAYVEFEGEGHGFRRSENIERAREAEFFFYSRVFGIDPADTLTPVEIEHEERI